MSIISPIPPDIGPSSAPPSTSSSSAFSFQTADLLEILEDLSTRFILNLPPSELSSIPRICFQVEQAFWFYEDFNRELNPSLPSYTLKRFSEIFFKVCPLLSEWSDEHEQMFLEFMRYKMRVPVCGAILINETWDKCLLVKGWKGNTWSFPKGKINQEEPKHICAAREVLEETGYDCTRLLNKNNFLETNIQGQRVTLFIVPGVSQDYQFKTLTRKEIGAIQWFKLKHLPGWKRKNMPSGSSLSSKVGNYKFYMILPFVQFLQQFIKENKPRNLLKNGDTTISAPSSSPLPDSALVLNVIESPTTPKQLADSLELMEPVVPEAEIPGTSSKSDSINALDELFKRFLDSHESESTTLDDGERTKGTNTPVPTFIADSKPIIPASGKGSVSMLDNLFGNITLSHLQPRANLESNLSPSSSEFSSLAPSPSPGCNETPISLHTSASSSTSSLDCSLTSAGTAASASMYHVQPQPQPHTQSSGQSSWNGMHRAPNPSLLALLNPAYPSPSVDHRQPQLNTVRSAPQPPVHSDPLSFGAAPLQSIPSNSSMSTSSAGSVAEPEGAPRLTLADTLRKEYVGQSVPSSQSAPDGLSLSRLAGVDSNTAARNLSKEKMTLLQTFLSPPSVHKLPHYEQQRQHQQQLLNQFERHQPSNLGRGLDGSNGDRRQATYEAAHHSIIDHAPSVPSSSSHLSTSVRSPGYAYPSRDHYVQTGHSVHSYSSSINHSHQRPHVQHHSSMNLHQQTSHQPYPLPPSHLKDANHPHLQQLHGNHYQHQSPSLPSNPPVSYQSPSASHLLSSPSIEPLLTSSSSLEKFLIERASQSSTQPLDESTRPRGYSGLPHESSPSSGSRTSAKEQVAKNTFQTQIPASYIPTQPSSSSSSMSLFSPMTSSQNMPTPLSAPSQSEHLQKHHYRPQQLENRQEIHRPIPVPYVQTSQHDLQMMNAQISQQQQRPQQYDQQQNRELADRNHLRNLLTGSSAGGDTGSNKITPRAGGIGDHGGTQSLLSILNSGAGSGSRGVGAGAGGGAGIGGRGNGTEAGPGRSQW